jgi:hypothetical protein
MYNSDLILTSAHSTIFLDAIVYQKPVIRLITNRWIGCFKINSVLIFNVKSEIDLSLVIQRVNSNKMNSLNSEEFILFDRKKWVKFISND